MQKTLWGWVGVDGRGDGRPGRGEAEDARLRGGRHGARWLGSCTQTGRGGGADMGTTLS